MVNLLKRRWILKEDHEVYEDLRLNVHVVSFDEIGTEFCAEGHLRGLAEEVVIECVDAVDLHDDILLFFVDPQHADQAGDDGVVQVFPERGKRIVKSFEDLQNEAENIHPFLKLHQKVEDDGSGSIDAAQRLQSLLVEVNDVLPDLLLGIFLRIELDEFLRVENGLIEQLLQHAQEGLETGILLDQLRVNSEEHVFEQRLRLGGIDLELVLQIVAFAQHDHQLFETLNLLIELTFLKF